MDKRCPDCGEILEPVKVDEMGSAPNIYRCLHCCLTFKQDAAGLVVEI